MHESGLRGRISAKKPLLKDTNNKKRLARAKKHEQLTQWKFVLCSYEFKFEIFGPNRCVFVRCRVGERLISACVVPTVKHGGGGVMVLGCLLFRIQGALNQHCYHSILQRYSFGYSHSRVYSPLSRYHDDPQGTTLDFMQTGNHTF